MPAFDTHRKKPGAPGAGYGCEEDQYQNQKEPGPIPGPGLEPDPGSDLDQPLRPPAVAGPGSAATLWDSTHPHAHKHAQASDRRQTHT